MGGVKDFFFGSDKKRDNVQQQSGAAQLSNEIILESLLPGIVTDNGLSGVSGTLQDFVNDRGGTFGSSLARPGGGIPLSQTITGPGTTTSGPLGQFFANPQNAASGTNPFSQQQLQNIVAAGAPVFDSSGRRVNLSNEDIGRTLLPSLSNIPTDTTTLFEAAQAGTLTDFEANILGQFDSAFNNNAFSGIGSVGGFSAGSANIGSVNVDDIGTITTEIVENLPPEFQNFIERIFNDTSPEAIEAELDNLGNALRAEAEQNAETLGGKLLSRFSALGLGTSGSAIEAAKELGVELAATVNSQIASARLSGLQSLIAARDQANTTLNILTSRGEAQRAQDVQAQIAEMDAKARIHAAALSAQAQVQSQLIASKASLENSRLSLLSNTLGQLIGSRAADEAVRVQGQTLQTTFPFELLAGIGRGPTGSTGVQQQGADVGGILGGLGGLGVGIAALSDVRFKENIEKIKEINPVTYNYVGLDTKTGGVIAQEIEQIFPDTVFEKDGIKYVDYTKLVGYLIKGMQELTKEVEELRNGS